MDVDITVLGRGLEHCSGVRITVNETGAACPLKIVRQPQVCSDHSCSEHILCVCPRLLVQAVTHTARTSCVMHQWLCGAWRIDADTAPVPPQAQFDPRVCSPPVASAEKLDRMLEVVPQFFARVQQAANAVLRYSCALCE